MQTLDEHSQPLAEDAFGRAGKIASRYARLFPEHAEDIESSAAWGACRAASSFREDGGQIWDRWSRMCINGEIKKFLARDAPKNMDPWSTEALMSSPALCEKEDSGLRAMESREALDRLLAILPHRHREICELVYKGDLSPYSAGQAIGLTGSQGMRIHRESLVILRQALAA